jgi:RimJ/RimL family protein N-acetyltransferase
MIKTPRLLLRPWEEGDGDMLAALLANPQAMVDMGGPVGREASNRKLDRFRSALQKLGVCKWYVERDGAFVGYCGVMPSDASHALGAHYEIGWRLLPQFWGLGLATEAALAALDHALTIIGIPEILAYTAADNHRSQNVMTRLDLRRDPARDFTMFYDDVGDWHGLVWVADGHCC